MLCFVVCVAGNELILDVIFVVRPVRVEGLALAGAMRVGPALLSGREEVVLPSLVPGLLPDLPFLLIAEAGRGGGGPMGLSGGLKKLDRRRSFGVDGTDCRLSMVRSDKEGREDLR